LHLERDGTRLSPLVLDTHTGSKPGRKMLSYLQLSRALSPTKGFPINPRVDKGITFTANKIRILYTKTELSVLQLVLSPKSLLTEILFYKSNYEGFTDS
jgi:hypothetical protein